MNPQSGAPISVAQLTKSFGAQHVLKGVTFDLQASEVTCVLGRSGTEKSVLLRLLIGLELSDQGSINLLGHDIVHCPKDELNEARKKVGFLFQEAALYDSLTIAENVAFPMKRHCDFPENERRERVTQLLASVGMRDDLSKLPSAISGGMKKRAGLARALALDPEVVMFDEPTAGLDPLTAAEIAKLIVDLREQKQITCLVVTHDLHTVRTISDQVLVLQEGSLTFHGPLHEFENSDDAFIKQFLKDGA